MSNAIATPAAELSVSAVTKEIAAFFAPQAVAKATSQARADIIAPLGKGTIAITPWQQDLFAAAFKGAEAVNKAEESNRAKLRAFLLDQYGSISPTFEQFKLDRAALRILAEQKGLVDDQWVRKPYNAAIVDLYGALPVSMSPAAVAKRAEREAEERAKAASGAAKTGAPKGETSQRDASAEEKLEQFIAKHGIAKVLGAAAKILAARTESKLDATTLQAVAKKYDPAEVVKAATKAARATA